MTDETQAGAGTGSWTALPVELRERVEAFNERWKAAQSPEAGDEAARTALAALPGLRDEARAIAAEVQAATAAPSVPAPDIDAEAALDGAVTSAAGAGETGAVEAWLAVPVPAGPRDEAAAVFDDWAVERDGDDDRAGATPAQLARSAPAYTRRLLEVLFPGEGGGDSDEAALMDAVARAYEAGGVEAARKAWREQEAAGIDVALPALWSVKPVERQWLVPMWLPRGRVVLFSGEGGGGKSRAALQLAVALATGAERWIQPIAGKGDHVSRKLFGIRTAADGQPVNVVIATWEDEAEEVARRLWGLGAAGPWNEREPDAGELGKRLHVADLAGAGPLWAPRAGGSGHVSTMGALTGRGRWLRRFCAEKEARLLIVDPLAAAFALNENDRGLVRGFMADWDRWGRESDCAVLLIAHPPKGDADWSGSTDWHAASRAVWTLGLVETDTGEIMTDNHGVPKTGRNGKEQREKAPAPRLSCIKSSYGAIPDPVWLRRCGAGWLADDAEGAGEGYAGAGGGGRDGRENPGTATGGATTKGAAGGGGRRGADAKTRGGGSNGPSGGMALPDGMLRDEADSSTIICSNCEKPLNTADNKGDIRMTVGELHNCPHCNMSFGSAVDHGV